MSATALPRVSFFRAQVILCLAALGFYAFFLSLASSVSFGRLSCLAQLLLGGWDLSVGAARPRTFFVYMAAARLQLLCYYLLDGPAPFLPCHVSVE